MLPISYHRYRGSHLELLFQRSLEAFPAASGEQWKPGRRPWRASCWLTGPGRTLLGEPWHAFVSLKRIVAQYLTNRIWCGLLDVFW